jgi:integrase/recombinase XerC
MTVKLPDIMTEAEWTAFIGTFNLRAATSLRNAAIFTLMHDAGLRTCEVVGLKVADVREDEVNGEPVTCLHLECTKGNKGRVVYLTQQADDLLRRWLEVKQARGLARFRHVFTTLKGAPVASSYLREVAARKGEEAGIGWRVHPHALRHTFATDLLEDTGDLALVQDALGHADPATTRIYAQVRNARLAAAMTRRKPAEEKAEEAPADAEARALAAKILALDPQARAVLADILGGGEGGQ